METMGTLRRTNYCGEVSLANAGQEMTVCGSIARARDKGGIIFADLRDTTGILQLVFDEDTPKDVFAKAESLKSEYVVICRGKLRERAAKTDKIATGDVELYVSELRILSEAQTTPFELRDEINVNDDLRLRYRYLDLRRPSMHEPIVLRSKIMQIIRNYFCENHFCEIETPTLIKSTPEGARDYLVPSRVQPGHFYALPQSPQLYKQILMLSGFDRYFQIARCYRDEDLRADRQPEFTQVDEEMSFVSEDDIMTINEGLIKRLWKEMLNIDVQTPFVRMPWDEAMGRFGSDKPRRGRRPAPRRSRRLHAGRLRPPPPRYRRQCGSRPCSRRCRQKSGCPSTAGCRRRRPGWPARPPGRWLPRRAGWQTRRFRQPGP